MFGKGGGSAREEWKATLLGIWPEQFEVPSRYPRGGEKRGAGVWSSEERPGPGRENWEALHSFVKSREKGCGHLQRDCVGRREERTLSRVSSHMHRSGRGE